MRWARGAAILFLAAGAHGQEPARAAEVVAEAAVLEHTRGDPAGAETLLRTRWEQALAAGRRDDAVELARALSDLLLRQGREGDAAAVLRKLVGGTAPAAPAATDTDPLRRLIRVLDTGTQGSPEVKAAIDEIGSLGALATDTLLAELDHLGAFGMRNVVYLLTITWNERARAGVLARLRNGDAHLRHLIGAWLDRLPAADEIAIARILAESDVESERAHGLRVLVLRAPGDPATRALADSLAAAEDARTRVDAADALSRASGAWAEELLLAMVEDPLASVRLAALRALGNMLPDDGEPRMLAAMAKVNPAEAAKLGSRFGRPGWVRASARVIPHFSEAAALSHLDFIRWIDSPDVAVPALLQAAANIAGARGLIALKLRGLANEAGYRLPPELDGAMVAVIARDSEFAKAWMPMMPPDGQERVLAHAGGLQPGALGAIAREVQGLRLPWHSVILLAARRNNVPKTSLLKRDWSGCSAAEARELAEIAATPDGQLRLALLNALEGSVQPPIAPLEVLLGDPTTASRALHLAANKDPRGLLAILRRTEPLPPIGSIELDALAPLLTPADLPLVLRIATQTEFLVGVDGGDQRIASLLLALGAGDLRLVEQASRPSSEPPWLFARRCDLALTAIPSLPADRLADALALAPRLDGVLVPPLFEHLNSYARPDHATVVAHHLERCLAERAIPRPAGTASTEDLACHLVALLAETGDSGATETLLAAMATTDGRVARVAAGAALKIASADARPALVARLLASTDPWLVGVAIDTAAAAGELRPRALEAVVRLASTTPEGLDPRPLLVRLPRQARIAAGRTLLEQLDAERAPGRVVVPALEAAGEGRDAAAIPLLARYLHHRHSDVRHVLTRQLGRTFDRAAVPVLLELVKDDAPTVAEAATAQLERMKKVWELTEQLKDR